MWKKCSEGQSGNNCSGEATTYTWDNAMLHFNERISFAGYDDWRMPTNNELVTLVYCSNSIPASVAWEHGCGNYSSRENYQHPTINQQAFPNVSRDARFWSSSSYAGISSVAWYVSFYFGHKDAHGKIDDLRVRLVRGEQ